ncbi:antitoxin [Corynebacterium sp. BCW_4722]|nr:antitoxin [Corynebacterium sp. BCW_4722]
MARNTSVTLGDHFDRFVAAQLATDRYASASEVLRAGLRLLEEREEQLELLRGALRQGLDSGMAEPFDMDQYMADIKASGV